MGCSFGTQIDRIVDLNNYGSYQSLEELVNKSNDFYGEFKKHQKTFEDLYESFDKNLQFINHEAKNPGEKENMILGGYLNIILCILHFNRSHKQELGLIISHYAPGIFLNTKELPEELQEKYENLVKLFEILQNTLKKLKEINKLIINDIIIARDTIPMEFFEIAKANSEILMINFGRIEIDWLNNYKIIASVGKKLDEFLQATKSCLIFINKALDLIKEHKKEFKKIIDLEYVWNYDHIPATVIEAAGKFIIDHMSTTTSGQF